jgi:hypothetical protein
MVGYDFEIILQNGKQNVMENELLRKEEDTNGLLYVTSIPRSYWVEEVRI